MIDEVIGLVTGDAAVIAAILGMERYRCVDCHFMVREAHRHADSLFSPHLLLLAVSNGLPPLRCKYEDLHIHFKHAYFPIKAVYQKLPIYVAVVSLLLRRR